VPHGRPPEAPGGPSYPWSAWASPSSWPSCGRRQAFEDQIKGFLDFIERYQWWVVIALFAFTFAQSAGRMRKAVPEVIEEIERPVEPTDTALRCRDGRGP
jgi:hypothetical protein